MSVDNAAARIGCFAALAGMLFAICASTAAFTAPASAEQYCWGTYLPKQEATCTGRLRFASEVKGEGSEHAVCVAISPYGPIKCSSGPGVWVSDNYGKNLEGSGWIQDHAPGGTYAYGEIF